MSCIGRAARKIRAGRQNNLITDMTGWTNGILTVLHLSPARRPGKRRVRMWRCRCECGVELDVDGAALRNGSTQSCGCLRPFVSKQLDKPRGSDGRFERIYRE